VDDEMQLVENTASSFIELMNSYGEDYNNKSRIFLEADLLVAPIAPFSCDIPEVPQVLISARDYFREIKYRNIKVFYSDDYRVIDCRNASSEAFGVLVSKELVYPDGKTNKYQELIFVRLLGGGVAKISSTASSVDSRFREIDCLTETEKNVIAEATNSCSFLADADLAYERQEWSLALTLYYKAKKCDPQTDYIDSRITLITTQQSIVELIEKADSAYEREDYASALNQYQAIRNYDQYLTATQTAYVTDQIKEVEGVVAYSEKVSQGDYYYSISSFDRAKIAYEDALSLRPGERRIMRRIAECQEFLEGEYLRNAETEIANATAWIEAGRKIEDAAILLLKYEETNLLEAKHLFYLAQILDIRPKKVKKAYGLSNRDCCVKTRIFMIQARNKSFTNDSFEYFWNHHLSQNARTCK